MAPGGSGGNLRHRRRRGGGGNKREEGTSDAPAPAPRATAEEEEEPATAVITDDETKGDGGGFVEADVSDADAAEVDDAEVDDDIHFDDVTPLRRRPAYARLDVLPFAVAYLALYVVDSTRSRQSSADAGGADASSAASFVVTLAMGLALFVHVAVVAAAQWSVRVEAGVGYRRMDLPTLVDDDEAGGKGNGGDGDVEAAGKRMSLWTHALVESNDGSGIVPVAAQREGKPANGGSSAAFVASCRFHDVALRCSTSRPEDEPDSKLWRVDDDDGGGGEKKLEKKTTGGRSRRRLRFRRLRYPVRLSLSGYYAKTLGHTAESALTAGRLYGPNACLLDIPPWSSILIGQLVQPFFLFQFLCVLLWMLDEYWYYALYTLFALLTLEATVAYQQHASLQRLHSSGNKGGGGRGDVVYVLRASGKQNQRQWTRARSAELVPGDVVHLKYAGVVPADVLLTRGTAVCDEALLTGESVPQLKRPLSEIIGSGRSGGSKGGKDGGGDDAKLDLQEHKESILFGGTTTLLVGGAAAADGDGGGGDGELEELDMMPALPGGGDGGTADGVVGVVLRTAFDTAQGSLLRTMAHSTLSKSNNASMHNNWDTFCFILILVLCALVAATHVWNHSAGDETRNQLRLLLHIIMIITSVVPPELPMELSLAITNSVADLIRRHRVFCTEPSAIPVAGQVDVCCFDKTGTLTSDEMRLKGVRLIDGSSSDAGAGSSDIQSEDLILPGSGGGRGAGEAPGDSDADADGGDKTAADQRLPWTTLRVMAACHSLATTAPGGGSRRKKNRIIGDPLEQAVLNHTGYDLIVNNVVAPIPSYYQDADDVATYKPLRILHRFAFSSKLKRMTVLVVEGDSNIIYALSKGAPETIKDLLQSVPPNYTEIAEYHMKRGRRVLAMGYRQLGHGRQLQKYKDDRLSTERNLIFAGFLVLDCPLKTDSKSVISELRKSKHGVVMITGDAILTATEVARQVGIIRSAAAKNIYRIQPSTTSNKSTALLDTLEMLECVPLFSSSSGDDDEKSTLRLSSTSLERLSQLKEDSKACFCMTGDVLVRIAAAALQKSTAQHSLDEKHMLLHNATVSILSPLVQLVSVFARHTPHQKEAVIAAFNHSGKHTLMCGDGTNDVGALKRASVGISIISAPHVESKHRKATEKMHRAKKAEDKKRGKAGGKNKKKSASSSSQRATLEESMRQLREAQHELDHVELGDASIAAPFTSRAISIKCCKDVIMQGRCTLVTMLSIYKILGINCLVNALVLSKLFLHGVKQGDQQLTVLGIAVAALFFFVTRAEPLTTLSAIRPPSSVLCIQALLSISIQFVIHAAAILLATEAGLHFVDEYDPSLVPDGPFNPNVLNSCSFLLTCLATINTFAVNYRGRPFMADLRENKLLYRSLQVCYAVLIASALEVFPPLNDLLQLTELPVADEDEVMNLSHPLFRIIHAFDFRVFICALMATDTILAFAAERFIIARFEG